MPRGQLHLTPEQNHTSAMRRECNTDPHVRNRADRLISRQIHVPIYNHVTLLRRFRDLLIQQLKITMDVSGRSYEKKTYLTYSWSCRGTLSSRWDSEKTRLGVNSLSRQPPRHRNANINEPEVECIALGHRWDTSGTHRSECAQKVALRRSKTMQKSGARCKNWRNHQRTCPSLGHKGDAKRIELWSDGIPIALSRWLFIGMISKWPRTLLMTITTYTAIIG